MSKLPPFNNSIFFKEFNIEKYKNLLYKNNINYDKNLNNNKIFSFFVQNINNTNLHGYEDDNMFNKLKVCLNNLNNFDCDVYFNDNTNDFKKLGWKVDEEEKFKRHYVNHGFFKNFKFKKISYKITFISVLCKCDKYIDNYINCLENLKDFKNHYLIITNLFETNNKETNEKINNLIKRHTNIKILNLEKINDNGLYECWNNCLKIIDTDLVCNFNPDDKLHEDFIIDYIKEFENYSNLNLLCCTLKISKEVSDTFDKDLPLMYNKKKIFYDFKDNIKDKIENNNFDYDYKLNLLKKCLQNNNYKTKTNWVEYDNVTIFDFFRIDNTNYIDLNNYNLFTFPGCCPVWKKKLFDKYGGFDEKTYGIAADIELWLRFFKNERNFKILKKSYVIYYNNPNSYGHNQFNLTKQKLIIKKYHPIFNLFNNKINVIIPYRDREHNLKKFIEVFKKTHDIYFSFNIYVIEQDNNNNFKRGNLFNMLKYLNNDNVKLLLTDVDLIYNKININFINNINSKLYGISKNLLSIGSGSILIDYNLYETINGYSNFYSGWGSEDTDFGYRLFFNNKSLCLKNMIKREYNNDNIIYELENETIECNSSNEKKEIKRKHCIKNNNTLMQQILNYNLIYYYENIDKFSFNNNVIKLNNKLFFEGNYNINNKNLINGKLYDLRSNKSLADYIKKNHVLIYNGLFELGLPNGNGILYNLWNNINTRGIWLNGYIYQNQDNNKKNNNKIVQYINFYYDKIDINNKNDFLLYKNYVYSGLKEINNNFEIVNKHYYNIIKVNNTREIKADYNIVNLHRSKKINCAYNFILDNYKINNFTSINNNNYKIITKNLNNYKLFYLNDLNTYQYPVITEKRVLEIYLDNNSKIKNNFFSYPWASLIDQINLKRKTYLLETIYNFNVNCNNCVTVCQHIAWRRLLPLFKKIGITHLFVSHKTHNDYIYEKEYNIKIYPFSLYPVNCNDKFVQEDNKNKKYLFSFKGSNNSNFYLNNIRDKLKKYENYNDCYIKITDKWFFNNIVYEKQLNNNEKMVINNDLNEEYYSLMKNSTFSLCPLGSGPNSIRFWESLSFGCIPVLLSNQLELNKNINWNDIIIIYDDKNIDQLYTYLKNISNNKINTMSKNCIDIYNKYFSKENFVNQINLYNNLLF